MELPKKILVGINNIEVVNNVDIQSLENNNNALLDDSIMKEKCSIKSKKSAKSKSSQKSGNSEEEDNEEDSLSNSGINMNDEKTLINKSLKPLEISESSIESHLDDHHELSNENEEDFSLKDKEKANEVKIIIQSEDVETDSANAVVCNKPFSQSIPSDNTNDIPSQIPEKENDKLEKDSVTMGAKIDPVATNDDSISSFELGAANSTTNEDNFDNDEEIIDEVITNNVDSLEITKSNNEDDHNHSFAIVKGDESEVSIEADVSAIEDKVDTDNIVDAPVDETKDIVESIPEPEKVEEKVDTVVESIPEPEKVEEKVEAIVESIPEPEKVEEKVEAIVESIPEPEKVEEKVEAIVESIPEPEKVEEKVDTVVESIPKPEKVEEKVEAIVESIPEPEKVEEKIEAIVESIPEPEKVEEKIEAIVESIPEPEKVEEKIQVTAESVPEPEKIETISEIATEPIKDKKPLTEDIENKKAQMEIIEQNIQALQQSMENDITEIKPPIPSSERMFNNQPPLKLNKRTSSLNLHISKRKESINPKMGKSSSKKSKHHKKIQQSIDEEIQSIANEINNDTIKEKFNDYVERRSSIQSDASGSSSSTSNKRASALSAYIIQNENTSFDSDISAPSKSNSQTSSNSKVSLNIDTSVKESTNSKEDHTPDRLSPLASSSSLNPSQLRDQLRSPTPTGNNRVYGSCISPSPSMASSSDSLRDQCISPTPSEESNVSNSSYSFSIGRVSRNKQFEVVYDHKPQLPDEIPLRKGDLVQIKQVFEDGWAYGIVKNKRLDGIFPIQCLGEEVEPARNQRMVPRLVRVYQARLEDEEQERQEEEEFKKKITDQARKNILLKLALSHPK